MADPRASRRIAKALASLAEMADPLERLEAIYRVREALEELAQEAAQEARADGATWKQIGSIHGVSKQAAQQRFRGSAGRSRRRSDGGDEALPADRAADARPSGARPDADARESFGGSRESFGGSRDLRES